MSNNITPLIPVPDSELPPEPEYSETIEGPDEDVPDISSLNAGEPEHRTILEIWDEVLGGSKVEAEKKVTPAWAARICGAFPQVKMQEMGVFSKLYFGKIFEMHEILRFVIEGDKLALKHNTIEDDREKNATNYKNVMTLWQSAIFSWELNWNCLDELSHVELAAMSEVHQFFFDQTRGIITLLENINFQWTEADQEDLVAALAELKEGHE